jgi:succinate dehydrogenase/fumarate reductase cytochrome b subunit
VTGPVSVAPREVAVFINWAGMGDVIMVGLIAGVGLVALFAVGVRLLAHDTGSGDETAAHSPSVAAYVGAALCFLVCAVVGIYGLYLLIKK